MSLDRYRDMGEIVGLVEDAGKTYAAIKFQWCCIEPVTVEMDVLEKAGIEPVATGTTLTAEISGLVQEEFYVAPSAFQLWQGEPGETFKPIRIIG